MLELLHQPYIVTFSNLVDFTILNLVVALQFTYDWRFTSKICTMSVCHVISDVCSNFQFQTVMLELLLLMSVDELIHLNSIFVVVVVALQFMKFSLHHSVCYISSNVIPVGIDIIL